MKKIFMILLCLVLFAGCQKRTDEEVPTDDALYKQYHKYYTTLINATDFQQSLQECQVSLVLNKTNNDNIRYDVLIDNPTIKMTDINAIAIVEDEKDYNPPSIGLLEYDTFSLEPGVVDKENGIYKGINLSGMTSLKDIRVKVYMTYYIDDQLFERFVELYGHTS